MPSRRLGGLFALKNRRMRLTEGFLFGKMASDLQRCVASYSIVSQGFSYSYCQWSDASLVNVPQLHYISFGAAGSIHTSQSAVGIGEESDRVAVMDRTERTPHLHYPNHRSAAGFLCRDRAATTAGCRAGRCRACTRPVVAAFEVEVWALGAGEVMVQPGGAVASRSVLL